MSTQVTNEKVDKKYYVVLMLDFWVDKDGDILVEERGMEPVDGVRKVGHVDSGEVYVY